MALNFGRGCRSIAQKVGEFLLRLPIKTFGDISHCGNNRPLNLTRQAQILTKGLVHGGAIYPLRKFSRLFPGFDFFKPANLHSKIRAALLLLKK